MLSFSFSWSPAICTSFPIPCGPTLTNIFHHKTKKKKKIQPLSWCYCMNFPETEAQVLCFSTTNRTDGDAVLQGLTQGEGDHYPNFLPREASGARNRDRTLTSFSLRSLLELPLQLSMVEWLIRRFVCGCTFGFQIHHGQIYIQPSMTSIPRHHVQEPYMKSTASELTSSVPALECCGKAKLLLTIYFQGRDLPCRGATHGTFLNSFERAAGYHTLSPYESGIGKLHPWAESHPTPGFVSEV